MAAGAGYADGAIGVWDLAERKERWSSPAHRYLVAAAAWSPDGKRIASRGADSMLRVWDTETGRHLAGFALPTDVGDHLAWLADGRTLHASGYAARQYEAATGRQTAHLPHKTWPGSPLGLSPDGRTLLLLSSDEPAIVLWDVERSAEQDRLEVDRVVMRTLALSHNGRLLAIGCRDYETQVWDLATGKRLWQSRTGWSSELVFSRDDRLLYGGRNHNLRGLWARHAETGEEASQLCDADQPVEKFSLSPDGRLAAILGWRSGSEERDLLLVEACSGVERYRRTADAQHATVVAFSPDGRRVLTASHDCATLVWDVFPNDSVVPSNEVDAAWNLLAAVDGQRAHGAVGRLLRSPVAAVALLEKRLLPAKPADAKEIHRHIENLVDDRPEVRRQAERELAALDLQAEPALRKVAAEGKPEELRQAARRALERLDGLVTIPSVLRQLRAIEALEHISTRDAHRLLERLSDGDPSARASREARAALERSKRHSREGARRGLP
jgi:WD40 repeat protein